MIAPFLPDTAEKINHIFATGVIQDIEGEILFPRIYIHTPDPRAKNPVIKESAETPAQETTDATAQEKVQISNQEVK